MAERQRGGNGKHKGKGGRRGRRAARIEEAAAAAQRVAGEATEQAAAAVARVGNGLHSFTGNARERQPVAAVAPDLAGDVSRLICRYPVSALLVSFGVGYLLAHAVSRR
jgi:hypothetical protein